MSYASKNGWDKFDIWVHVEEYQADLDEEARKAGFTVTWPATREGLRDNKSKVTIVAPSGEGGEFNCWLLLWSEQSVEDYFREHF
jgi:hypothetical protein